MFDKLKKKCSQMSILDWVVSSLLIIVIISIVMWVHSDKQGDNGTSEEGFVDVRNQDEDNDSHCNHFKEHFADSQPDDSDTLQSIKDITDGVSKDDFKLLFVYHSQCGHCHEFQPMWKRLSEKYKSKKVGHKNVKLYSVGNDTNEELWNVVSSKFGIEGYPTILVLQNNGTKLVANEYTGPRHEFQTWCSYINGQCNS